MASKKKKSARKYTPKIPMIPLSEKEWLGAYLAPLVGATIDKVEVRTLDGQEWPVLHVSRVTLRGVERHKLEVSQDVEGNGPGFLLGLPRPE